MEYGYKDWLGNLTMKMASISLPNHDITMNQAPLHPPNHDIPMVLKTKSDIEPFFLISGSTPVFDRFFDC